MANWSFLKPAINTAPGALNPTSPYSTQFPGSSPYTRLSLWAALDKVQHQRGSYLTTSADLQSPWISGEWRVNFDDVFADTNYSVLVGVDDSTTSYLSPAIVVQPVSIVRSPAYVSGQLYFPLGQVPINHPFTICVLAVHS